MTRRGLLAVFIVTLAAYLIATNPSLCQAEQVDFSLQAGQWATAGDYMVRFNGLSEGLPAYDLFSAGGVFLTSFSPSPAGPYEYEDVSVLTIAVTPDGLIATGTMVVR